MSAYSGIYTDIQGLAELRTQAVRRPESALDQVAGQFEALFTRMMLKMMRESSLNSGLFESSQSEQYMEMFDGQVAVEMSRGRGLGLKQILTEQLGQLTRASRRPDIATMEGPSDFAPASQQEFITGLLPFARQVEKELGISHKAVLAQAALESGWGRHTIRRPDGGNSFNLFGIKAGPSWTGDKVAQRTVEFEDGIGERVTEKFRAYASLGHAVRDYASLIRDNPRYRTAIEHGKDPHAYARELQRSGYATDPDYAKKIGEILDSDILRDGNRAGVM
ncbi:MAG: glucosaminidase domain-containing protein [Gammaproteobacteria bacterium]|nr:glucosaminidase domain-containing protein [Gammaproteobacteria bacterium]